MSYDFKLFMNQRKFDALQRQPSSSEVFLKLVGEQHWEETSIIWNINGHRWKIED